MSNLLCTVVIPVFNAADHIEETLHSVFVQSYRPLEVIIVDDGSSDGTGEIVRNYVKDIDQENTGTTVHYVYQDNSGPSIARNRAMSEAHGEYIAFLDSDDLWPEEKIGKQIALMKRHGKAGMIFGDSSRFSESGTILQTMFERNGFNREFFGDDFYVRNAYKKLLYDGNFITTGSVIVKRKCIDSTGMFDENIRYSEDVDLWLRIAMNYDVGYCRDICLFRRMHSRNVSDDSESMYLGYIKVMEKHGMLFSDRAVSENINIKCCIQKKYLELAQVFYMKGDMDKARVYYREGLTRGFNVRAFLYLLTTYLGSRNVERLRRIKERVPSS